MTASQPSRFGSGKSVAARRGRRAAARRRPLRRQRPGRGTAVRVLRALAASARAHRARSTLRRRRRDARRGRASSPAPSWCARASSRFPNSADFRRADGAADRDAARITRWRSTPLRFVGEAVVAVVAATPRAGARCGRARRGRLRAAAGGRRRGRRRGGRRADGRRRRAGQHRVRDAPRRSPPPPTRRSRAPRTSSRSTSSTSASPPCPIEPRSTLATFDAATGRLTLRVSCQTPTGLRDELCDAVLGIPKEQVRVVVGDVGGGFGMKTGLYPEDIVVAFAARALEAAGPVHGRAHARSSSAASHGRDVSSKAELALDANGRMLALRVALARQRRRLRDAGGRRHPAADRPVGRDQHLRHRDDRHRHQGGADQHAADRRLSRRGPARGDLHHRAADGRGGARDRHRPRRAAPAQHDPARADAVHEPDGQDLRQRPVRAGDGPGARAGRLERLRGARGGLEAPRPAARAGHRDVPRMDRRRRVRGNGRRHGRAATA